MCFPLLKGVGINTDIRLYYRSGWKWFLGNEREVKWTLFSATPQQRVWLMFLTETCWVRDVREGWVQLGTLNRRKKAIFWRQNHGSLQQLKAWDIMWPVLITWGRRVMFKRWWNHLFWFDKLVLPELVLASSIFWSQLCTGVSLSQIHEQGEIRFTWHTCIVNYSTSLPYTLLKKRDPQKTSICHRTKSRNIVNIGLKTPSGAATNLGEQRTKVHSLAS